jgi:hypothetical protein
MIVGKPIIVNDRARTVVACCRLTSSPRRSALHAAAEDELSDTAASTRRVDEAGVTIERLQSSYRLATRLEEAPGDELGIRCPVPMCRRMSTPARIAWASC